MTIINSFIPIIFATNASVSFSILSDLSQNRSVCFLILLIHFLSFFQSFIILLILDINLKFFEQTFFLYYDLKILL